jgi:hypothetical protein
MTESDGQYSSRIDRSANLEVVDEFETKDKKIGGRVEKHSDSGRV